ncbi:hypothetical protein D3C84_1170580 [compost metagenome]
MGGCKFLHVRGVLLQRGQVDDRAVPGCDPEQHGQRPDQRRQLHQVGADRLHQAVDGQHRLQDPAQAPQRHDVEPD